VARSVPGVRDFESRIDTAGVRTVAAPLDRAAIPCQAVYQYTRGGSNARNPLPPDQARWGRFDEIIEQLRDEQPMLAAYNEVCGLRRHDPLACTH
jgi:hypothetical protein